MSRESQRLAVREARESLIRKLDLVFKEAFEDIDAEGMGEGAIARLTQLILHTRAQALANMEREIKAPLITSPSSSDEQ